MHWRLWMLVITTILAIVAIGWTGNYWLGLNCVFLWTIEILRMTVNKDDS